MTALAYPFLTAERMDMCGAWSTCVCVLHGARMRVQTILKIVVAWTNVYTDRSSIPHPPISDAIVSPDNKFLWIIQMIQYWHLLMNCFISKNKMFLSPLLNEPKTWDKVKGDRERYHT